MTWGEAAGTGVDPCPAVPTSDVPPWGCPEGDYWGGVEGRWFPVPNLVPPTLSLSPYSHPCALLFATSLQGTLGLVGGCWSCAPPPPPHPRATEPPGHCVPIIPNCSLGDVGQKKPGPTMGPVGLGGTGRAQAPAGLCPGLMAGGTREGGEVAVKSLSVPLQVTSPSRWHLWSPRGGDGQTQGDFIGGP